MRNGQPIYEVAVETFDQAMEVTRNAYPREMWQVFDNGTWIWLEEQPDLLGRIIEIVVFIWVLYAVIVRRRALWKPGRLCHHPNGKGEHPNG